jgi:peptide chain release factor subunit 1
MTKNYFMEKKVIHHELEKKVIGIVDTAYTDEGGIRELVQKSQDLLKDSELVKERQILDKFLGEVARDGLATYGQIEVEKAIEEKRASTLIISEDIPWIVFRVYCEKCEKEEIEIVKEPETFEESKLRCKKCESKIETIEEISYLDYMIDKAKETGAQIKIISTETNEGKNFYEGFGGMAALLRYRI